MGEANSEAQAQAQVKALPTYEERVKNVTIISTPLATKKQTKKCYKLIRKVHKVRGFRRGVKEVVKAIRKGEKGICIIAGDITPIDVVAHIPVMCEDRNIPYIFTPSKADLGSATLSKRPTSTVLITPDKPNFSMKEAYDELFASVEAAQRTY